MDQWLGFVLAYGQLGVGFGLAALAALLLVGAGLVTPRLVLLSLVLVVVVFPNSASTAVAGEYGWNVFGKGQRFFFFSVVELVVMALGLLALAAESMRLQMRPLPAMPRYSNPYLPFYLVFALFCVGYALADLGAGVEAWPLQFGRSGVMTLVIQGLLVTALVRLCDRTELLRNGFHLAMGVAAGVVLFGLARYAAFGGDPQGVYETDGASLLKLTFWDINYLVISTALGCWLLWRAAGLDRQRQAWQRVLLGAMALLAFVAVALSARRTAQIGVLLALIGLWFLLPRGRKWGVVVLLAITASAVGYKLSQRIDDNRPLMVRLLKGDLRQQYLSDPRYDRYYELRLAWRTVQRNPALGVGPAGVFEVPGHQGLEYHRGNYGFIHSGFGHVLLKTGFVGLAALLGLLASYLVLLVSEWRRSDHEHRGWLLFSAAGMLALLPTLLLGTPFIELRTALTMGLLVALPLMLRRLRVAPGPTEPVVRPARWRRLAW